MNSLIFSTQDDLHAQAIRWAIRAGGFPCELIDTALPLHAQLGNIALFPDDPDNEPFRRDVTRGSRRISVLNRRFRRHKRMDDVPDMYRGYAQVEALEYEKNLHWWLDRSENVYSINPYSRLLEAENKSWQLYAARRCGLDVPPTLMSASPERIRNFLRLHPQVVVKPFQPHTWRDNSEGKLWTAYARAVDSRRLMEASDAELAMSPAIYQPYVPIVADVRVVVIGDTVHALAMHHREPGDIDFRQIHRDKLRIEPILPPADITSSLLRMMGELRLGYCASDFVIDTEGRWRFLELNPAGSFLFLEEDCPDMHVLAAMCSLLVCRRVTSDASLVFPSLAAFYTSSEGRDCLRTTDSVVAGPGMHPSVTYINDGRAVAPHPGTEA
ncbi:hypothetical protein EC912_11075 [Luteibacter rhizovicinus]|uniref:ATP-grasp domain-containing protein n=1 Tax=Luteibacter rhizovicinus TaxID=242606 RepID=A0A4R3YGC7_9GAMM|nr:hypothetical protein [Luteibacter rhizovicinus]TCV91645.1 hypothetical protein EC912_11075 [Luteibacter rhizovicinus]